MSMAPRSLARPPPSCPALTPRNSAIRPPLVRERLPVHQDESGDLMRGDDRARHHGLARCRRRDQHPQIVPGQDLDGRLLRPGQHGRAGECLRGAGRALIGQVQLAACLRGEFGHDGEHAARHDQPAVDGLVEELQEPGDVPGRGTHPLLLVELRVVHRGSVPQRRGERGRQVGQLDPDARAEPRPDHSRRLRPDLRGDWRGKPGDLASRRDPPGLVRGPAHLLRRHAAKR